MQSTQHLSDLHIAKETSISTRDQSKENDNVIIFFQLF